MNAAQLADRDQDTMDGIADTLAVAYLRLHRAAAIAQHLAVTDPLYRDRPGWDLSLAIQDAITAIDHSARTQELAARHEFWAHPLPSAAVAAANTHATLPATVDVAAERLLNHLGAALNALIDAEQHTSDAGIDDALHAVCTALRTATTHPATEVDEFWEITI